MKLGICSGYGKIWECALIRMLKSCSLSTNYDFVENVWAVYYVYQFKFLAIH